MIESEWCHTDVYDFMIFYVMSFFLFGFVWGGVVVWCFGKTNFFFKKKLGGSSALLLLEGNCSFCFSDKFMGRGDGCR